jgi:cell division protein FtsB
MKWLAAALLLVLAAIQYRIWISDDGVRELRQLRQAVESQRAENERLSERNRQLAAEVRDLKQGYAALEERARSDLGMISRDETFYQVVPPEPVAGEPADAEVPTRTAAAR